jgi:hypothetical protein
MRAVRSGLKFTEDGRKIRGLSDCLKKTPADWLTPGDCYPAEKYADRAR